MEITLPNSQGNQSFRSVAGKRSSGRAVYLGDPRLALQGRSPVGAEKSALATPCPVAASSVFSGKVQSQALHSILIRRAGRVKQPIEPADEHPAKFNLVETGRLGRSPTEGLRLTCPRKALGGSRFNSRHGTVRMGDRPDLFFDCDLSWGLYGAIGAGTRSRTWEAVGNPSAPDRSPFP